jgi:hypothetical protein
MTSDGVQATTIPSRNACRDVIVLSSVNPLSSGRRFPECFRGMTIQANCGVSATMYKFVAV